MIIELDSDQWHRIQWLEEIPVEGRPINDRDTLEYDRQIKELYDDALGG